MVLNRSLRERPSEWRRITSFDTRKKKKDFRSIINKQNVR